MVEINFTLWIQAVNFLVMLWFLNRFVFKPVLNHIDERERKIKGISDEAEQIQKRGEEALAKYENEIVSARRDAAEIIASIRQEAQDKHSEIVNNSREEFNRLIEESRTRITEEVGAASDSLKTEIDRFAGSLAEKILGRKVAP